METGYFYFLKDTYCSLFSSCGVMGNKEMIDGEKHGRPCYFCFEYEGYNWMIPVSSKVSKYKSIYESKSKKYRRYYGIRIGFLRGQERAFLIQNICPVPDEYIDMQYMESKNTVPVTIDQSLADELCQCARAVLAMHKNNINTTMTDLTLILSKLSDQHPQEDSHD